MTSLITFLVPVVVLVVTLYFLKRYYLNIKPAKLVRFYTQQGAEISQGNFKDPNDRFGGLKNLIQRKPTTRMLAAPFPGAAFLLVLDPVLIKEMLLHPENYDKMSKESELSNIFSKFGLTRTSGEIWKKHRKVLSSAFQYNYLSLMIPSIEDCTKEFFESFQEKPIRIKAPFDIEKITSEVISRIFFGIKSRDFKLNGVSPSEEASNILAQIQGFNDNKIRFILGTEVFNILPSYRAAKKRIIAFREFFMKKINERMIELANNPTSNSNRRDFLQIFLEDRQKYGPDSDKTFSDDEILDEFAIFYIAGKDTTSTLLAMMLYCYCKYPEWAKKVEQEIQETIHKTPNLTIEAINSMDILTAFIKEVLRYYPPAPGILPRRAIKDHKIGDIMIKKGTILFPTFIANHFNPRFFENPNEFNPERWLNSDKSNEGWKNETYAYLPFPAGPRNCIGQHLAIIEAKTIMAIIVNGYDIQIDGDYELKMLTGGGSVGYHPKDIPLILSPKSNK